MFIALSLFVLALASLGLGWFAVVNCRQVEIDLRAFGFGFVLRINK
jgi:hypothetical protein